MTEAYNVKPPSTSQKLEVTFQLVGTPEFSQTYSRLDYKEFLNFAKVFHFYFPQSVRILSASFSYVSRDVSFLNQFLCLLFFLSFAEYSNLNFYCFNLFQPRNHHNTQSSGGKKIKH